MDRKEVESTLYAMLDDLAAIEHERWSRWQRHMHKQGKIESDGSLRIPSELVRRWEQEMATPYSGLSEAAKDSDRDQVRRYLPKIVERFLNEKHG
jgi:hypothetical protein